jgi:hypothetical protein
VYALAVSNLSFYCGLYSGPSPAPLSSSSAYHGRACFGGTHVRWCMSYLTFGPTASPIELMVLCHAIQLYFWAHSYSSPKWRNLLAWIVGCTSSSAFLSLGLIEELPFYRFQHDWDDRISCVSRLGCSGPNHGCRKHQLKRILHPDEFESFVRI